MTGPNSVPRSLLGREPLPPQPDPLDGFLDAILTSSSRESQLRILRLIRADVAQKMRMETHNLVQDALGKINTLETPKP